MELEALQATLQHLQERPRMHIFDERYTTFVAYIDGLESEDGMCRDFSDWLARRYLGCDSNKHWVGLINDRVYPDSEWTPTYLGDLDETASAPLVREMFERWSEFLTERRNPSV